MKIKKELKTAINVMVNNLSKILQNNLMCVYLYGSITLNDFKLGWSDIDLLVLTKEKIDDKSANELLTLRQTLLSKNPKNPYYRSFEGAILSYNGFINNVEDTVVYWGTKGEKIKNNYNLDSFSLKELKENGILLYGKEVRDKFKIPSFLDLKNDIVYHYNTIREHAQTTGRNFYSFGWLLDISRCLYTLKTGKIISKTKAGVWALKNKLCPKQSIKSLKMATKVRKSPLKYKDNKKVFDIAETLGSFIQEYANVLQKELNI